MVPPCQKNHTCNQTLSGFLWLAELQVMAILFTYDKILISQIISMMCVCVCVYSAASVVSDPMGCSPPGSSVHGILQARILEWVSMPTSRGSSQSRGQTCIFYISCIEVSVCVIFFNTMKNTTITTTITKITIFCVSFEHV